MKRLSCVAAALVVVLSSPGVLAQVWVEQGDAGHLPTTAQVTIGQGPLVAINGTISDPSDVDMYCIYIDGNYQASLCENAGLGDSRLFLFQQVTGTGLSFIDDVCARQARLGVIQPPPGNYLIAIAGYDREAVGGTPAAAIWLDQPFFSERTPDGPGASSSVTGWTGIGDTGAYSIALSGVSYCQSTGAVGGEYSPEAFMFSVAVPNPFATFATFSYQIPWSTHVKLLVYDGSGRCIATLADGREEAGTHSLTWNGRSESGEVVASGVYLARLDVGGIQTTQKIVLVR